GFLAPGEDQVEERFREYFGDTCRVTRIKDYIVSREDTGKNTREMVLTRLEDSGPARRPDIFAPSLALALLCDPAHRSKIAQAFCWGEQIRFIVS
ncbi:hypothetical protein, partial [Salmonella enterica]|uniref:hypothetical protein n=1 Tax=Salmonella enterica TaxID=28901 RepID=UPI0030A1401D